MLIFVFSKIYVIKKYGFTADFEKMICIFDCSILSNLKDKVTKLSISEGLITISTNIFELSDVSKTDNTKYLYNF